MTTASDTTGTDSSGDDEAFAHSRPDVVRFDHEEYDFAVLLTHDVDRVYRTYQGLYDAITDRDPDALRPYVTGERPYWNFEEVMRLEDRYGVRSTWFFLDEQRLFRDRAPREWIHPRSWVRYTGRYDPHHPSIRRTIRRLADGGWEVGLHGSFESYADGDRLREEKASIEAALDGEVRGIRQHYLNLERPATWRRQRRIGLSYDASLGSSTRFGFHHGYGALQPYEDFLVFPLTMMDSAVRESAPGVDGAWRRARRVIDEAERTGAILSVLWHPRTFDDRDFPGYGELYDRILADVTERNAWVGTCADLYDVLDREGGA